MSTAVALPTRPASRGASLRRELGLVAWQVRYEQRAFWRNRARSFFAFLFPIMFLVVFASLFSGHKLPGGGGISYNDFFVPGILAYGVIMTTFVNIAVSTAILRDDGVLKRMQGTPLPRWAYLAGRIGSAILITLAMTAVTLAFGSLAYGVRIPTTTLPGFALALALGTACFTTLGVGIVRFIGNAEAAPPIVNIAILPLTFISGIWFANQEMPHWLREIAQLFPVHALADAFQYAFDPRTVGLGIRVSDLKTLSIWLAVGVFLMIRFLRQPLGEGG
ncbi:MAG TPA: ABC transporter permease [Solirubrobacteraceae bacterium]|jgi:ABC-2 type transport system permease protein|nr:ABC transporter permease [Solirubrobacteraceae bacterium]